MRGAPAFLALVVGQALHSAEEYVFQAYDLFPPARWVSSQLAPEPERGFVMINLAIIGIGVACYWWPMRRAWRIALPLAWLWVVVELINGGGHSLWSIVERRYTPGAVTAVILLLLALNLARHLLGSQGRASGVD